jgi:DNA-binding response OmpR family regulator
MFRILLSGSDSRLLATRAAVLSKTGAAVVFHNAIETLEVLNRDRFDLVVLCHSLTQAQLAVIVDKVHQKIPGTKILMVTSDLDRYDLNEDGKVDATSIPEPAQLVARVKELLQVTSYASAAKRRDGVDPAHLTLDKARL